MAHSTRYDPQTPGAGDPAFTAELDRRIAAMRRLLATLEPPSTAMALKTLRSAFPESSLDDRVRALQDVLH
jgi:hypothetical protein